MREKKYKSSLSPQDGALAYQTDEGEALNMGSYAMVESAEVRTPLQPEATERGDAGVKRKSGVLTGATVRRMGIYLLGVLILAVASIPLHFADRAREQRVEELREQQYEDFKERYGL